MSRQTMNDIQIAELLAASIWHTEPSPKMYLDQRKMHMGNRIAEISIQALRVSGCGLHEDAMETMRYPSKVLYTSRFTFAFMRVFTHMLDYPVPEQLIGEGNGDDHMASVLAKSIADADQNPDLDILARRNAIGCRISHFVYECLERYGCRPQGYTSPSPKDVDAFKKEIAESIVCGFSHLFTDRDDRRYPAWPAHLEP